MAPADDSAHPYRIETTRRAVILTLAGGGVMSGNVFIPPSTYRPFEFEDIAELFNAAEPFFPLELPDGGVTLVAKDRVAEVMLSGGDDVAYRPASELPMPTARVEVFLAGDHMRTGSLQLEVRPARERALDFLNHLTSRFLTLHTETAAQLINRSFVDRVLTLN